MKRLTNYLRAAFYLFAMIERAYMRHEKLTNFQNRKVREIVRYAYDHVPFYHYVFKNSGVKPDDVKTAYDLKKLPIIGKDTFRTNITEVISSEFDVNRLKKVSTSGSTGQPLTVFLSEKEDEFRKAKHLRANVALGQKARDRWIVIAGPQHFREATKLQRFFGIYATIPLSVFDDETKKILTIQRLKPDILDGYSSSLFLLAKEVEKRGLETIRPRFIIGGAELIDDSQRHFIEKSFDAPFYDQYSSMEFGSLAWQCKEKMGYHVDADSVIMQIVDENGDDVAPGEKGEIVCTSLFNHAMPFIRYAIGDVGISSEDNCPCGRTFPLMELVEGRKDSFITLPNGRVYSPHVFCLIMEKFKFYDSVDHYRIIQRKIDLIEFQIKLKTDVVEKESLKKDLIVHFKNALNIDKNEVTFEVESVKDIPLDETGKLTTVVSKLSKEV